MSVGTKNLFGDVSSSKEVEPSTVHSELSVSRWDRTTLVLVRYRVCLALRRVPEVRIEAEIAQDLPLRSVGGPAVSGMLEQPLMLGRRREVWIGEFG